jgi:hypothetical protein
LDEKTEIDWRVLLSEGRIRPLGRLHKEVVRGNTYVFVEKLTITIVDGNKNITTITEGGDVITSGVSSPTWERVAIFAFGVIFVGALLAVAIFCPNPTQFQYTVFRIILALAAAGIAALIPGLIKVKIPGVRAGGALAVFVFVYYFSPAALVTAAPQ